MNYNSRIRQVEKQARKGDGPVHIEVARYDSNDKFDEKYSLFQARKVLGLVSFDEQRRTIFVCDPEAEAKYQNMTPEQAKKIVNNAR